MTLFLLLLLLALTTSAFGLLGDPTKAQGISDSVGNAFIDNGWGLNDPPFCMGVILNSYLILTLASCCQLKTPYDVMIQAGSTRMMNEGDYYFVDKYLILDKGGDPAYSLGMIRVNRKITFTHWLLPIAISRPADVSSLTNADHYYIFGPGGITKDDPELLATDMMKDRWPLQPTKECESLYGKPKSKESFLCLGNKKNTMLTPHDVGAPLVLNRMLYGLGCYSGKKQGTVAYFINIGAASDRIYQAMRELHPPSKDNFIDVKY